MKTTLVQEKIDSYDVITVEYRKTAVEATIYFSKDSTFSKAQAKIIASIIENAIESKSIDDRLIELKKA